MEAILYICHGSRLPEANRQAIHFVQTCMKNQQAAIQEYSFLELANPTIEEAYERCVQQGATKIIAVPILLLTAAHAKFDIPELLAKAQASFPEVELTYGRPIGVNERMVDILVERLLETKHTVTEDSLILLVGRGSSDPDVKHDLGQIAKLLESRLPGRVEDCYLTASEPGYEEALEMARHSEADKIFIIPYLLFTGILMKSMRSKINKIEKKDQDRFVLCQYLGYHSHIASILTERIQEMAEEGKDVSHHAEY